jgi:hypothetical protein
MMKHQRKSHIGNHISHDVVMVTRSACVLIPYLDAKVMDYIILRDVGVVQYVVHVL